MASTTPPPAAGLGGGWVYLPEACRHAPRRRPAKGITAHPKRAKLLQGLATPLLRLRERPAAHGAGDAAASALTGAPQPITTSQTPRPPLGELCTPRWQDARPGPRPARRADRRAGIEPAAPPGHDLQAHCPSMGPTSKNCWPAAPTRTLLSPQPGLSASGGAAEHPPPWRRYTEPALKPASTAGQAAQQNTTTPPLIGRSREPALQQCSPCQPPPAPLFCCRRPADRLVPTSCHPLCPHSRPRPRRQQPRAPP